MYITYQLHVSANAAVAIIRLDTIYQRSYIDIIQHRKIISITVGKGNEISFYIKSAGVCADGKEPCL